MSGDLASGGGPRGVLAAVGRRGGDRSGGVSRLPDDPAPLRIPAWACYRKDDIFGLCDTLARAERAMMRAGELHGAAELAVAFDVLESGLT
jgi:hypothetical protein